MKFVWLNPDRREAACPVCSSTDAADLLHVEQDGASHAFVRCLACRSVYPLNFEVSGELGGYAIGKSEYDMGLKHYVEIGAGIDSLIAPILELIEHPRGSLLDVGCGFGFLPFFWDRYSEDTFAHGIELASYGHWGRELLGAPISHSLLAENEEARKKKYDFFWSGEVIEHVPDPVQFVADLGSVLKPDGVLMLTTPNADCVNRDTPPADLAAALSLGSHRFLLSEEALCKIVSESGIGSIATRNNGTTLIVWASRTEVLHVQNTPARVSRLTEQYLLQLANTANPWVRGGAFYRLFKLLVNAGRYTEASQIERQLTDVVVAAIGLPSEWSVLVRGIVKAGGDFIDSAPAYLGPFLHYRGILKLNLGVDYPGAVADFDLALRINAYAAENHIATAQEASRLIASCIFHRQLALRNINKDAVFFREFAKAYDPEGAKHFEPRYESEATWTN